MVQVDFLSIADTSTKGMHSIPLNGIAMVNMILGTELDVLGDKNLQLLPLPLLVDVDCWRFG